MHLTMVGFPFYTPGGKLVFKQVTTHAPLASLDTVLWCGAFVFAPHNVGLWFLVWLFFHFLFMVG
jgi:hypothetical protein